MLYTYYQSFSKVLLFARRKVPFTFKELLNEMEKSKIIGLVNGMMIIPGVVAEGDELFDLSAFTDDKLEEFGESSQKKFAKISEREGPFKDRFLSMFDEMIDSHVFDD
ncbi:hypothetical protein Anas_04953 [Armadillidium nasatum]|uniref:Uncharacterized protein n=1 Tax=Armadillidium nasatum TaxID=96803 RepID=A0A5N5SYJ4_9CRUS|nr:hypothetical protein Anas_04953 [Armadillidium nasatum]